MWIGGVDGGGGFFGAGLPSEGGEGVEGGFWSWCEFLRGEGAEFGQFTLVFWFVGEVGPFVWITGYVVEFFVTILVMDAGPVRGAGGVGSALGEEGGRVV